MSNNGSSGEPLDEWLVAEDGTTYDLAARREAMKKRTKAFALSAIRLYASLPKTTEAQVIGKQFLRTATSVGAHYREAVHARCDAELIAKVGVAEMELEEAGYWLELLVEGEIVRASQVASLEDENRQLSRVFAAIAVKLKSRSRV